MTPADRALTTKLTRDLVAASGDTVRRVIVFGSRARGTSTPSSDVDMLLLLEVPTWARWTPRDNVLERNRLLAAATPLAVPSIELWVRTTDQFEEAKDVAGAVEHAAASQGVTVYERAPTRRPVVRRSRDVVRAHNVADWIGGALQLLDRAGTLIRARAEGVTAHPRRPHAEQQTGAAAGELAARAARWACTALLVLNDQVPPDKRRSLAELCAQVARFEPRLARRLEVAASREPDSIATAHTVLREITARLRAEPRLAPLRDAGGIGGALWVGRGA